MSDCISLEMEVDSDDDVLLLEDEFSSPEPVPVWNHQDQCKKLGPESNCQKASKKGAAKRRARPKPLKSLPPLRNPAEVDSELRQMVASKGKGIAKQL